MEIKLVLDISTKPWLNTSEAIIYLGVIKEDALRKLREENKIPFSYVNKKYVYKRTDLDKFLESHMHHPHRYKKKMRHSATE